MTANSAIERVAETARNHPAREAISTLDRSLSYGDLLDSCRRIQNGFAARGITAGDRVGLYFEREVDGLVAWLATLGSGAIGVPLLSSHPAERLRRIVEDAGIRLIVATTIDPATAARLGAPAVAISSLVTAEPVAVPPRLDLHSLAMLFYTAGTTGEPKGVAKSHRVLASNYARVQDALQIVPGDRVAVFSTFGMGQGATAIMTTLLNGATVCPFDIRQEGLGRVCAWMADGRLSIWISSTTLMRSLARTASPGTSFPGMRVVRLSGERVLPSDVADVQRLFPAARIVVTYNSTETGVITVHAVDPRDDYRNGLVPVGRPARDVAVSVVDDDGQALGPGLEGEIIVRSADIAEGYWGDAERTASAFVTAPDAAERTYRTGDLGRWRPDGTLEHLGRKDRRVKIRGFRIELEEIEHVLTQQPAVVNAAVAAAPGADGDLRLVAYVQLVAGNTTSVEMLRALMALRLPPHMIPGTFVFLEELPIGPSGKIARQRLPQPPVERPPLEADFAAPRSPREQTIAETWREVLGLDRVGIHDGFLALGGDSLKATLVATRLATRLGRDIPMATLFESPTIAELAAAIDALPPD